MKKIVMVGLGIIFASISFSQSVQNRLGVIKSTDGKVTEKLVLGAGIPFDGSRIQALAYESIILAQPFEENLMILYKDESAGCFGKGIKSVFFKDPKTRLWYIIDSNENIVMAGIEYVNILITYSNNKKTWRNSFPLFEY